MRTFLSLAFRNIFRNRRRTLMMLVVVAGGVSALLLAGGYFSYMFWGLRETTIRNGLGHLQIYNRRYFDHDETRVLENGLAGYENVQKTAQATPHVPGVAPRIEFFGMVSNGQKSGTYMGTAVDPAAERRMRLRSRRPHRPLVQPQAAATTKALLGRRTGALDERQARRRPDPAGRHRRRRAERHRHGRGGSRHHAASRKWTTASSR